MDKIKALKEEKDKRSKDIKSDSISETKEQAIADSKDLIDTIINSVNIDDINNDNHISTNTVTIELLLLELGPRIRTSRRKRKITIDNKFETY